MSQRTSDTVHPRLKVVIIGLGQIGSRFDEEPGRTAIWSHAGAYLKLAETFELVAAVDPDQGNRQAFAKRCPEASIYSSLEKMFEEQRPEIISICTPAGTHCDILLRALKAPSIKAIWCEKPAAIDIESVQKMIEAGEARSVPVLITHNRRWAPLWKRLHTEIMAGTVGDIRCIRIAMPNRLWSVGSHAVDLALMLGGEVTEISTLNIPELAANGEPAVAAMLRFQECGYGIIQVTGGKNQLVVEAEILGDNGRMIAIEDANIIVVEKFEDCQQHEGYRRLVKENTISISTSSEHSIFIEVALETAALAHGTLDHPTCGIRDSLSGMVVLERMNNSARKDDQTPVNTSHLR
jgi:predicted dehydrogenase